VCETRLVVFFRASIRAMRYSGIAFSPIILTRQRYAGVSPILSRVVVRGRVFTLAEARIIPLGI